MFYPAIDEVSDEFHELVIESPEEHGVAKKLMEETAALVAGRTAMSDMGEVAPPDARRAGRRRRQPIAFGRWGG